MVLIIGGAYQGKRDYAKKAYHLTENDIFTCNGTKIDFSKKCIDRLEEFVLACVREGIDPESYLREHEALWQDCVFICRDIFCGVVPMDPVIRKWRHTTGLVCQYLAGQATQVSRIFCGLEQRLK